MLECQREFEQIVRATAQQAEKKMRSGAFYQLYLYGKPGEIRAFSDSETPGEKWTLVTPEALTASLPFSHYKTWIRDRSRHAPVLSGKE